MTTITDVATRAASIRKPSKTAAFELLVGLIENGDLTDEVIAAHLYAFFQPGIPAKPKTPEQWVARAVAVKDVRFDLNYLYSDGKRLMGMDGHRLHIIPTERPAGYYDKQLSPVVVDHPYVDVDRVIPEAGAGTPMRV